MTRYLLKLFFKNEDINFTHEQQEEHLNTLKSFLSDKVNYEVLNYIYESLNILDNKVQSLLTFNSILLAILVFWIDRQKGIDFVTILYYIAFIFHLTSSLLCLSISFLKWASTNDLKKPDETMITLFKVREMRTKKYRLGLLVSIIAILIVSTSKIIDLFLHHSL